MRLLKWVANESHRQSNYAENIFNEKTRCCGSFFISRISPSQDEAIGHEDFLRTMRLCACFSHVDGIVKQCGSKQNTPD